MLADIRREVQLNIIPRHEFQENIASNILTLEYVSIYIVRLGLGAYLVNRFGLVQVKSNRLQPVRPILLIEQIADLLNTDRKSVV